MVVWALFLAFVFVLLALDLGVFHRRAHVVSVREALGWTVVWILTALAFAGVVYLGYEHHWLDMGLQPDPVDRSVAFPEGRVNDGRAAVLKFLTGYVVEKSLSVDNVFVIAMLFGYFGVPRLYQHRVLFWGILGALAMRGAMIAIGAHLVSEFSWVLYVFGGVLILTAVKMMLITTDESDPGKNVVVRLMRRFLPVTDRFHGEHFFVRAGTAASREAETPGTESVAWDAAVRRQPPGTLMLTPLALALVMVETTDLIFAVDSIPAIFAITADPFLVFTSNVFAILGLRSLYFALAGALHTFRYLKHALALVLVTVGIKMLAHTPLERALGPNFNLYLLVAVLLILGIGVLASVAAAGEASRRRERMRHRMAGTVRTLQDLMVPDHLIATIQYFGQRAAAARSTPRWRGSSGSPQKVMVARDVMTRAPEPCRPDTTLVDVARLMAHYHCSEIPVVDRDSRPVGLITDHDIITRVVARGGHPADHTARMCMSQPVVSVSVDAPFGHVVVTMARQEVRRVPVVDAEGRYAGTIAEAQIASVASEQDLRPLSHKGYRSR